MFGEDGIHDRRNHRLIEADNAGEQWLAVLDFFEKISAEFFLNGMYGIARIPEFADRSGARRFHVRRSSRVVGEKRVPKEQWR